MLGKFPQIGGYHQLNWAFSHKSHPRHDYRYRYVFCIKSFGCEKVIDKDPIEMKGGEERIGYVYTWNDCFSKGGDK